ncbi:MAG TPA: MFS transporter [Acidimicrobiales bacterium]|nr:MFS transporter [Acidimicrobiales bacterium]
MSEPGPRIVGIELRGWLDPAVLSLALLAMASGFGQFGAVSALGDVAKAFGHATSGNSIADRAGLSGTELGVGLAVLRLASLGGLPLAGLADRLGRRTMLLLTCSLGLVLTVVAATSPGYWWFVAIFALGRPLLSATSALAQVGAAEETASHDRAKAIGLIAAGYALGSGLTAVLHGLAAGVLGFRGIFALALLPLIGVALVRRHVVESERFAIAAAELDHPMPVFGAVSQRFRRRLLVVSSLAFCVSVIAGPANSFVFVYAQNVLKLSGAATAVMVVVAGPVGLVGLLLGRYLADHLGRRPTGAMAMAGMAVAAAITYSGPHAALYCGYELAALSGGCFAPAAGALANELFPTSVRASVAGWNVAAGVIGAVLGLLLFGAVADVGNRFAVGGLVTFVPMLAATGLFWLVPETKGREPEEMSP